MRDKDQIYRDGTCRRNNVGYRLASETGGDVELNKNREVLM